MSENPLGTNTEFPTAYKPDVLYPIPRWPSRSMLDIDKKIPLHGFDYWRAYEVSWLNSKGKPQVGVAEILVDARSEYLIESKSLKLYLNSLNNEKYTSKKLLEELIAGDLKPLTGSEVHVRINGLNEAINTTDRFASGISIDAEDIDVSSFNPDAGLLTTLTEQIDEATLLSDLFRSRCPITGQPDWASVMIRYSGSRIDHASLLAYLCSFRNHQGYHEECTEMIFRDLMVQCRPDHLVVGLFFTGRGGIDINPIRSNHPISPAELKYRTVRQ